MGRVAAVLVIMNTADALCRERNRQRDRPVPAPVLTDQLRRIRRLLDSAEEEGWDQVLIIDQDSTTGIPIDEPTPDHDHDRVGGPASRAPDLAVSLGR